MAERLSHILLITDDEAAATLIMANMGQLGYLVSRAQTLEDAQSCMGATNFDLIILERLMAGFNTFLFVEQLMFDPACRNVPMVFLAPEGIEITEIRSRPEIEIVITRPINQFKLVAGAAALLERGSILNHVMREDTLTRVLNRQALEEELERELGRVRRYQCVGSLVFLDLDNFKKVNDQFGHAVGDQTLRYAASVLKNNVRQIDIVGRYGGEEFVLYLPETSEAGALTLANRLLDLCVNATDGPPGVTISFSAGVAEAPRDGDDVKTLAHRADEAMYVAKKTGKRRVVSWHTALGMPQAAQA